MPEVSIDWVAAPIISVAAVVDFFFRGVAFRRVDSFGLSLALFATAYSAVELARAVEMDISAKIELQRFALAAVPLLGLTTYHIWCREKLERQLDDLFDELDEALDVDRRDFGAKRSLLRAVRPVARNSVLVTFVGRRSSDFRPGKRTWREEVVRLVSCSLQGSEDVEADLLTVDQLLLPKWMRRLGGVGFLAGGFIAFLAQVLVFSSA